MNRDVITETTTQPQIGGCECGDPKCQAHLGIDEQTDEGAQAPLMFLVRRGGSLKRLCPNCVHPESDLVVARLYGAAMTMHPFLRWDAVRVGKLYVLFGGLTNLPVEADYVADPTKWDAEAGKRLEGYQAAITEALSRALMKAGMQINHLPTKFKES